jgi:hypothetical protein
MKSKLFLVTMVLLLSTGSLCYSQEKRTTYWYAVSSSAKYEEYFVSNVLRSDYTGYSQTISSDIQSQWTDHMKYELKHKGVEDYFKYTFNVLGPYNTYEDAEIARKKSLANPPYNYMPYKMTNFNYVDIKNEE